MKRRSSGFGLVLAVGGLLAWAATSGAESWKQLGQAYVDYHKNPAVIPLVRDAGAFSRIKVQVKETALKIVGIKVFVAGGDPFDVPLDEYMGAGKATKPIDVPGGPKAIERVEVTYHNGSDDQVLPLIRIFGES